ncbi:MAG: hypothetical protein LCH84_07225 [Gemmatimonadetes bacterium]|nr:hypothetical protein [Gemmatimonadota bacterium]
MFITLLAATLAIATLTSVLVARFFSKPIASILSRIVAPELAGAWTQFLRFAIYVVGISGGVRIYELEAYVRPAAEQFTPPALTTNRWVLEVYRTIVGSLQATAWMLLVFFVVALIAYVIVTALERRHARPVAPPTPTPPVAP